MHVALPHAVAVAAALIGSLGCATKQPEDVFVPQTPTGASDATAPTSDAGKVDAPSTTPPAPDGSVSPATPAVELPFLVSDEYIGSGFMGDSQPAMDGVKMSILPGDCKTPRATGAAGECYSVTWTPPLTAAGASWAGVYWQSPANNWGAKPGKRIAKGATKLTFYAAGAVGGEKLEVRVGGINTRGGDPSLTYRDTFTEGKPITLTATWDKYEIPLTGASYEEVLGGFAWVASATVPGVVSFYIDDIRWEK